jgi:hypothetical protein
MHESPPDITSNRQKILQFGVSFGFVSCVSLTGLFLLSQIWDPPSAGSIEAPNTLLSYLGLLGNLSNLVALVSSAASWTWSKQGFVAVMLFSMSQVLWLILLGVILVAHGF